MSHRRKAAAQEHTQCVTLLRGRTTEARDVRKTRRQSTGDALIYFCVVVLVLSSAVKFLQPPQAVDFMRSMGYEHGTYFLIACLELLSAVLLGLRSTRPLGLLLVSSYLGGAIAAHLADHPNIAGGAEVAYLLSHPYVGLLLPAAVLAAAWTGVWLRYPRVFSSLNAA